MQSLLKQSRIIILVPVLNERIGVERILPTIQLSERDDLIVIDGQSVDGTKEWCKENDYHIINQYGKGVSDAFAEGYYHATSDSHDDIFVLFSPDGNSQSNLIPAVINKIREGYDMVIVSRYKGNAKSYDDDFITAIGNKFFTALINILFRSKYTDTLVMFRAIRKDALEQMGLQYLYYDNEIKWLRSWEIASCCRAAKLGLKVAEIEGDEPKRIGGIRKMNPWRNGLGALTEILIEKFCNFL